MNAADFKSGQRVRLKSGGSLMTVDDLMRQGDTSVPTVWFTEAGECRRDRFGPVTLIAIEETHKP